MLESATTTTARGGRRLWSRAAIAEWRWATFPLLLFVSTRVALLGFSQIGMTVNPGLLYETAPREFLRHYPALDGLCRWDCYWFKQIALNGYADAKSTNFFPLFPLLARALSLGTGLPLDFSLLVIPNLAGLGAYLVIYRLFTMLEGEPAARWGLTLFAAYPFAFFQAAGYPESLMIFFSALAILLALRGNHIWAGVVLGLGVLARHLTLFAGGSLLVAQARRRGFSPKRFLLSPAILGLLVPWLVLGLYSLFQYTTFGDPIAFWSARATWGPLAWWGIGDLLTTAEHNEHIPIMLAYVPFAAIPTIGAAALATRKRWLELAAFAIVMLLVLWAKGIWGLGRYSASCWPAFLPLGLWLSKRLQLQGPAVGLLAVFQGLFFYLFSHGFPIL